ncbi:metallophosphoesterase [Halomonas sp. HL-93]|uniref:metallophosphoesterase n=1 Tax=Halomonas sp. HL-93 TaxID=1666906 RepID=UPI0006DA3FF1|nr:metallophosphoesterase [Halomonas sp. HL-93]KPQ22748.1 MAG: phosphohydrolase Icc [Halomonas sp. HL-93]SBR49843.1 Icc protein [Halomonas sp. HL-93]
MRLIQITDAHLYADKQTRSRAGVPWRHLQRVLQAVITEQPDLVVFSGDISQDETAASYTLAYEAMSQLSCPWVWLAGNHDQPALMLETHPLHDEVALPPWRMLLLHTQVEGGPYGELGQEALASLSAKLKGDERPTLIVMHHPPVDVGAAWMDAIGLQDRDAFWDILSAHPQVKVILFGHAHQAYAQHHRVGEHDVAVYGCPAISDQFMPGAKHFMIDEASRPGYRIVDLKDQQWDTWIERVTV